MYQALYRKWRPRTFDDVVGQPHITETLKNQIKSDRLSHAYLFIGTRGTGKTSCAKILARAVNCEQPVNGNPCNRCPSCMGIESGSIMDVVELDAASNNGVDNVRALRDEAVFTPASVKKRVYIVDEVHMLSASAFNALLKILEEPPAHLMFVLATTELHKIPATILSRCQRHSFKRLEDPDIAERLTYVAARENLGLEEDAAVLLARLADGSLRDALSLLDQCSTGENITSESVLSAMGLAGNHRTSALLKAICDHDIVTALSLFRKLWQDGKDPASLLDELAVLQRDILMNIIAPHGGQQLLSGGYDMRTIRDFSAKFTAEELINNIGAIHSVVSETKTGRSPRTSAELCLIGLCQPELGESPAAIRARVARLEATIFKTAAQASHQPYTAAVALPPETPGPAQDETEPAEAGSVALSSPLQQTPVELESPADSISEAREPEESESLTAEAANVPFPDIPFDSGRLWLEVVQALSNKLPVGTFSILSDSFHADGVLSSGVLTVFVKNSFAMSMLNKPDITDLIRDTASNIAAASIPVKMVEGENAAPANPINKLDELSRFGNVKFE